MFIIAMMCICLCGLLYDDSDGKYDGDHCGEEKSGHRRVHSSGGIETGLRTYELRVDCGKVCIVV